MVNVENMVNFLGAGDWERAAVEARRARILMLQSDLDAGERYESGLAWALAGVSLQLAGRHGEAHDCFRSASEQRLPGGPDPAALGRQPGPGEGSVLVLVQNGKAPVRAPADYYLFFHDGLHRLEIPALAARSGGWGRAIVEVDGSPIGEAPLLLDLAAQAAHRWDDEFPRLLAAAALQMIPRVLVGTAVRKGLETQSGHNPEQDSWAWLAGFLSEELIAEALPTDTRCWSLLPRDVRALRLSVPAGEHTVTVRLASAPAQAEQRMEWSVTVDEGGFALVNAITSTMEGWTPTTPPHGGDVSHTAAGQQALSILEAALAWREIVRD
jgi:hypothetical protein